MVCVNIYSEGWDTGAKAKNGSVVYGFDWHIKDVAELSFDDLAADLDTMRIETPIKEKTKLWNFTRLIGDHAGIKRNQRSAFSGATLLVLDIDGEISLDDFCKEYDYLSAVCYTTHSHRSARKQGKDCFRVLMELTEDIPWDLLLPENYEHGSLLPALTELFPFVDATCFEPMRGHYLPSHPPGGQHEVRRLQGEPLRWTKMTVTPAKVRPPQRDVVTVHGGTGRVMRHTLDLPHLFEDKGWVKQTRGDMWIVECPNHLSHSSESDASKLINFGDRWGFKCHHSHCGGTKWLTSFLFEELGDEVLRPYCETVAEGLELKAKSTTLPEEEEEVREVIRPATRTYNRIIPYDKRIDYIKKAVVPRGHSILRTAEGFGKSTKLVQELLRTGEVLFCCSSHEQVRAKMEDFAEFRPQRVYSLRGLLFEELGVEAVYTFAGTWEAPAFNERATLDNIIEKLQCSKTEAEEALTELRQRVKSSRDLHSPLCITTFATGSVLSQMGYLGRTIIVDDPNTSDLLTKMYEFETVDGREELKLSEERHEADVMFSDEDTVDKVIWTTTERLVMELIKEQHPEARVVDVQESLATKHLMLHPTTMTRKKLKFILPGMHRYINRTAHHPNCIFIANGVKSEHNLVSTKGRNDLKQSAVIVISKPHPLEVAAVAGSLGRDDTHEVAIQMCVDVMDQAIGRSQGYRGVDSLAEVLVLCDPKLEVSLVNRSRYELPREEGFKRRGKLHGVPITWSVNFPSWWSAWISYLSAWQEYVRILPNGKVYNLLDGSFTKLSDRERAVLNEILSAPAKEVGFKWKKVHEQVEGQDEGRRNYSVTLSQLVDEYNRQVEAEVRATKSANGGKGMSKRTGKVRYTSPDGKQSRMCIPGEEPSGWLTKSRKVVGQGKM